MGLMDSILADDAKWFVDADTMPGVESGVYTTTEGITRTIKMQVWRETPVPDPGAANVYLPDIRVWVRRDADAGTTAIVVGVETITIPVQYGGDPVKQVITKIISEDAGGFMLALSH